MNDVVRQARHGQFADLGRMWPSMSALARCSRWFVLPALMIHGACEGSVYPVVGPNLDEVDAEVDRDADGGSGGPGFSFVVFGDNQHPTPPAAGPCDVAGNPERLALPLAVLDLEPRFILHTGDLMDRGDHDGAYEGLESYCYSDLLAQVPLFPTLGNHDAGWVDPQALRYRRYLRRQLNETNAVSWGSDYADEVTFSPSDETDYSIAENREEIPMRRTTGSYYAWRYANAFFISMEVGTVYWTNTPKAWLRKELAGARADARIDHIFVYLHNPVYSTAMKEYHSKPDGSIGEQYGLVRDSYQAIFRDYDVTMVFSGHSHMYEHLYVPDDGQSTRTTGTTRLTDGNRPAPPHHQLYEHSPGDGIHYLVTGGGGGNVLGKCIGNVEVPERDGQAGRLYSQGRSTCTIYHVLQVQVTGTEVRVNVVGYSGDGGHVETELWESFTLTGGPALGD